MSPTLQTASDTGEPALEPQTPPVLPSAPGRSPQGAPWTFLCLLGLGVAIVGAVGLGDALVVATLIVNGVFLAFFFRHVAFAPAAVRWAGRDLYHQVGVALGYQPSLRLDAGRPTDGAG